MKKTRISLYKVSYYRTMFVSWLDQRFQEMFAKMDVDKNSTITKEEAWMTVSTPHWKSLLSSLVSRCLGTNSVRIFHAVVSPKTVGPRDEQSSPVIAGVKWYCVDIQYIYIYIPSIVKSWNIPVLCWNPFLHNSYLNQLDPLCAT